MAQHKAVPLGCEDPREHHADIHILVLKGVPASECQHDERDYVKGFGISSTELKSHLDLF